MDKHEIAAKLFPQLEELREIIETRIAVVSDNYPCEPTCFWMVIRNKELICVWSRNLAKDDKKIIRLWDPAKGLTWHQWYQLWLACHEYL